MTEDELEIWFLWQLYDGILERFGLKPSIEGFLKFRRTRWTKETLSEEAVIECAKQCEEVTL